MPAAAATFSVIVPVHNEAARLGQTVPRLLDELPPGCEVVYVCNGCTDGSAALLSALVGKRARILEAPEQGKAAAIRCGEEETRLLPRFYVDADVVIGGADLSELARCLEGPFELVSPRIVLDLRGVGPVMRRICRLSQSLPHARRGGRRGTGRCAAKDMRPPIRAASSGRSCAGCSSPGRGSTRCFMRDRCSPPRPSPSGRGRAGTPIAPPVERRRLQRCFRDRPGPFRDGARARDAEPAQRDPPSRGNALFRRSAARPRHASGRRLDGKDRVRAIDSFRALPHRAYGLAGVPQGADWPRDLLDEAAMPIGGGKDWQVLGDEAAALRPR